MAQIDDFETVLNLPLFNEGPVVVFVWKNAPERPVEEVSANIERLCEYDHLTNVYNRKKTEMILMKEFERVMRYGGDCSIIICDIDRCSASYEMLDGKRR